MARHISGVEISRYADGECAPPLVERIEAHLATCAACRAQLHTEFALGEELRSHFADASVDLAPVRRRRLPRPARFALAAAAAVIVGFASFPQLTSEFAAPGNAGAGVTAFATGIRVGSLENLLQLTTVQGFVVARSPDALTLRVGLQKLRVVLAAGTSDAPYPVGAAVLVHGLPLANGSLAAIAIQRIQP